MGNSQTTPQDLAAAANYRNATGTSFAHTTQMYATPAVDRKIHESVDPKRLNTLGKKVRECFDSDEHPETLPVVVAFDETGSMGQGAYRIQEKLALLKGITLRNGQADAQLCFGAYGDELIGEKAPCQIGQFESGIEMTEWLNNLYIEGNGGGNHGESSGLLMYFLANFSDLDSLKKRGKKGYLFLTGDEISHNVTKQGIKKYIDENVEADISIEDVVEACQQSYEIFFFLVNNGAARSQGSEKFWSNLLGTDHVVLVEDLDNIAELIAGVLALEEGISLNQTIDAMKAEGSSSTAIELVSNMLAAYDKGADRIVATTAAASGGLGTAATAAAERL